MSKQKQIEKLAKIISESDMVYGFGTLRLNKPESQDLANQLIEAGYSHADEVRKETAREILNVLNCYPHEYHEKVIKELAAHYGLEVKQ